MSGTWVEAVRAATTVGELSALFNELGGKANGPEFAQVFSWRKAELENANLGDHFTALAPAIQQVFDDWDTANKEMSAQGKLWARADAELKRLQGRKFLFYKQQGGGSVSEIEAKVNDDSEVFDLRLARNENEAAMKVSYKIIELLEARWAYLQSLMVTERAADSGHAPQDGRR